MRLSVFAVIALVLAMAPLAQATTMMSRTQQAEALKQLQAKANAGDTDAQRSLGTAYLSGYYGLARDVEAARPWFVKAAEAGNTKAYFEAGVSSVNQPAQAERWLLMAAGNGDTRAYAELCSLYRTSALKDWDKALIQCRAAAEHGSTWRYAEMAGAVEKGLEGQAASLPRAMDMYAELAGWRDRSATLRLADIYAEAPSSADNDTKLLRYTWLAAGFTPKIYLTRLAQYLETGRGVAADPEEAGRFYLYAAPFGSAEATAWLAAHPEVTRAMFDARQVREDVFAPGVQKYGFRRPDRGTGDFYPERASVDEVEGDVVIECRITAAGDFENCIPATETPRGYGFGAATLGMVTELGIQATDPAAFKPHARKLVRLRFAWRIT